MKMCRVHHIMQHKRGWRWMSEAFESIERELDKKGWEFSSWGKLIRK